MTITATLAVSATGVIIETPVNCLLTVTNSVTGAINVSTVQPIVTTNGGTGRPPASIGVVDLGPNAPVAINAAGSTGSIVVPFKVIFHAPSNSGQSFAVGCLVTTSDGSAPSVTAQTVAVSGITQLPSEL